MLHRVYHWLYRRRQRSGAGNAYKPMREGGGRRIAPTAETRSDRTRKERARMRRVRLAGFLLIASVAAWFVVESLRNVNFFQQ